MACALLQRHRREIVSCIFRFLSEILSFSLNNLIFFHSFCPQFPSTCPNMADQDQGLRIRHGGKPAFTVEYHALKSSSGSPLPSSAFSSPGLPDGLRKNNFRRPYRGLEWYSVLAIFVIGLWSTLLSGAWFVIAVHKPHWDFISSNDSVLTPTTASTLTTALAKTIEVSFVSFFLAIVGQYFTRKASDNEHSGISLADLQLKVLMVLSGTLITSWKSYGRVLRSFVGITSLIACVSALLYTTASDALGKTYLPRLPIRVTVKNRHA